MNDIHLTVEQITVRFLMLLVIYISQGPDLQRILRQTYDRAALTPDLRRACELRAINKKS